MARVRSACGGREPPPPLVLASASPRRRELLALAGYTAEILPSRADESTAAWLTPRELVLANAWRKAASVRRSRMAAVVLGVDTLVSLGGEAFGKPLNIEAAAVMLARLAGREHEVYSGVCAIGPRRAVSFVEVTKVRFQPLSEGEISAYLALIDPLDKAGGYAAQEHAGRIIAAVDGSESNVIGLPMERLEEVLRNEFSISPRKQRRRPAAVPGNASRENLPATGKPPVFPA